MYNISISASSFPSAPSFAQCTACVCGSARLQHLQGALAVADTHTRTLSLCRCDSKCHPTRPAPGTSTSIVSRPIRLLGASVRLLQSVHLHFSSDAHARTHAQQQWLHTQLASYKCCACCCSHMLPHASAAALQFVSSLDNFSLN